jgi:hypothetical protein
MTTGSTTSDFYRSWSAQSQIQEEISIRNLPEAICRPLCGIVSTSWTYRPMAGGVCSIDNNKQNTTSTPNPPTTSMICVSSLPHN